MKRLPPLARMDMLEVPLDAQILTPTMFFVQLGWYVRTAVLLVRIWRKVRHLPG